MVLPSDRVPHYSVMVNEVIHVLAPRDGGCYLDATFGAGGYSRALLQAAECTVWAIDRDPVAKKYGALLSHEFPNRITLLSGQFSEMVDLLAAVGVSAVDGIAIDLGVSSMQLDDPARGFSFRHDGPLDMRMGQAGVTAADVVNTMAEKELADIIYTYGEERASRKIAKAIVDLRQRTPITRTQELAELVRSIVRKSKDGIDPATRTFQALRIHVNDELGEVERGLRAAEAVLAPGGRLAVVTFHSLEDRLLKRFLRERSGNLPGGSRHLPFADDMKTARPTFDIHKKSGLAPGDEEIRENPRSRSARMRWAERTAAAPWIENDRVAAGGSE